MGVVYFLKTNSGILSAFEAATGRPRCSSDSGVPGVGNIFASPVAADGRLSTSPGGAARPSCFATGPSSRSWRRIALDDEFDASLEALVDDEIYLRGHRYLYRVTAEPTGGSIVAGRPGLDNLGTRRRALAQGLREAGGQERATGQFDVRGVSTTKVLER